VFSVLSAPKCYKRDKLGAAVSQSVAWSQLVGERLQSVTRDLLWLRPGTVREPRVRGMSKLEAATEQQLGKTEDTV
jgi:hypothetical protein